MIKVITDAFKQWNSPGCLHYVLNLFSYSQILTYKALKNRFTICAVDINTDNTLTSQYTHFKLMQDTMNKVFNNPNTHLIESHFIVMRLKEFYFR